MAGRRRARPSLPTRLLRVGTALAFTSCAALGVLVAVEEPAVEQVPPAPEALSRLARASDPGAASRNRARADSAASALAPGARGDAVVALQRRLRARGFQVATATGVYDDETLHSVTALQKLHGLAPDGVAGPAVLDLLAGAAPVRAWDASAGFHVEVDLSRQVALLVRGGTVERVYDVSTGSGKRIKAPSGRVFRATTPTGRFRINRKIDGVRHAELGDMYRPSYLGSGGIAFHGGQPVVPYPDSHGCIRMTDRSIDEIYPLLRVGTEVLIH